MKNTYLKIWSDFVVNEGILPAPIIRKLGNFDNSPTLIAKILIERENFKTKSSELEDIQNAAQTAFLGDTEMVDWLKEVTPLLQILEIDYNNIGHNLNLIDAVNGACLSFIKSCYLLPDKVLNNYINQIETKESKATTAPFDYAKEAAQKEKYSEFLAAKGYSANTINSYRSAINNIGALPSVSTNIWAIQTSLDINDLVSELEYNKNHAHDDYKEKDIKSNKTLSNALKRYCEFVDNL